MPILSILMPGTMLTTVYIISTPPISLPTQHLAQMLPEGCYRKEKLPTAQTSGDNHYQMCP